MDLYERLQAMRLRTERTGESAPSAKNAPGRDLSSIQPGPDWTCAANGVWFRETRFPVPDEYRDQLTKNDGRWGPLSPALGRGAYATPLFFDLETTGLSAGSGNVAFLAGFGSFLCGRSNSTPQIAVRQYFLSDYGSEHDFVEAMLREMRGSGIAGSESLLVSYNGSSFDLPVVSTRCIMNGLQPPVPLHLDLLPVSRRLWKTLLPDCRLSTIETRVLNLERDEDIPGALAPYRYHEFHRTADPSVLREVFSHHRYDIRNLAFTGMRITRLLATDAPEILKERVDAGAVSRILYERGDADDRARAIRIMDSILDGGAATAAYGETLRYRAFLEKRKRNATTALRLFTELWKVTGRSQDGVEVAKLLEHRFSRYSDALAVCHRIEGGQRLRERERTALARRMERLITRVPRFDPELPDGRPQDTPGRTVPS